MDSAAWLVADDPVVGIVDPTSEATDRSDRETARAIDAALAERSDDGTIVTGALGEVVAEASLLVAIGASGLSAVTRTETDCPVLPVGPAPGIETVAPTALSSAIGAVLDGTAVERQRPLLSVESGTESTSIDRELALFDVTLVADEPARISEYSVRSHGEEIAQFRADGVVVATPAGSYGYARAVDGPQLSGAIDAVAVTPIAPFVTTTRRWVLPDDDLTLGVERDGEICLLADDRPVGTIDAGDNVSVGVAGTLSTLVVPEMDQPKQ